MPPNCFQRMKLSKQTNESLRALIFMLKRDRFGSKSEGVSSDQLDLEFNEVERVAKEEPVEKETITYERKKPGGRKPISDLLPRTIVEVDVPEEERTCPHGHEYKEIGREISEKVEYKPAQIEVIQTQRIKRACRCDECEAIKVVPPVPSLLPKTMATPSLLAFILISKYVDHLPLYRITAVLQRVGLNITRATLASWVIKVGEALTPLINLLNEYCNESFYVGCDETRCQVLKEEGKKAQSKSYIWTRVRPGPKPIVLYHYDPTRSGDVPKKILGDDFRGYLHSDGYAGYNAISLNEYVVRVACLAHIRRKFKAVYDYAKKHKLDPQKPGYIIKLIKRLYKVEDQLKSVSESERFLARLKRSKPIMDDIKTWLDEQAPKTRSDSPLGEAIKYALGQWPQMMNYLSHGALKIDNNFTENEIRPFALGRKNWLFSTSVQGMEASTNIYSLIRTAKANRASPLNYMAGHY